MKQGGLFGHLKLDPKTKEKNQNLINQLNNPNRVKQRVTVGANQAAANKIATRVAAIQAKAVESMHIIKAYRPEIPSELITDEARLNQYIDNCLKNGIVHLDTEGSGLDPIDDFTCGVCLWTPGETRMYAPFMHTDFFMKRREDIPQISVAAMQYQMQRLVDASWEGTLRVILGNAKYDIRIMKNTLNLSHYIKPYWDVIFAGSFLNENEPHGLKYLWGKYVDKGQGSLKYNEIFEKIGFNWFDPKKVFEYAAFDPVMTGELFYFQEDYLDPSKEMCKKARLLETANIFREEMNLMPYLAKLEDTGVCIDKELGTKLEIDYGKKLKDARHRANGIIMGYNINKLPLAVRTTLDNPVNIGSPNQLAVILYDLLGLTHGLKKEKPRGTGEPILENLKEKYPEHQELFNAILDYRGLDKLYGTYVVKMPAIVKEKTGRLHGTFNQYGAKTGRFSSKDPNLQNIPSKNKDIRPLFIASEGYYLVSGDYSQQEPRVLAHVSGDEQLINAYLTGKDLYAWVAAVVYKVDYNECLEFHPETGLKQPEGKQRRDSMKSVVLGLMYGRGASAIAEQIGSSKQEAQRIIDMFFDNFPKVKIYVDSMIEFCRKNGYVQTVWGRKRRLPDINLPRYEVTQNKQPVTDSLILDQISREMDNAWGRDKNKIVKDWSLRGYRIKDNGGFIADAERQTINSIIQGTSADITKIAMLRLAEDPELNKLGFRMLITVHDEIIGEAPKENALRASERMAEVMIAAAAERVRVPMAVDCEVTERWYGKDLRKELAA